jgi:hypothetical protein
MKCFYCSLSHVITLSLSQCYVVLLSLHAAKRKALRAGWRVLSHVVAELGGEPCTYSRHGRGATLHLKNLQTFRMPC